VREFGGWAERTLGCGPRCGSALAERGRLPRALAARLLAVELYQRGAETADGELPGSYRPAIWAGNIRR